MYVRDRLDAGAEMKTMQDVSHVSDIYWRICSVFERSKVPVSVSALTQSTEIGL